MIVVVILDPLNIMGITLVAKLVTVVTYDVVEVENSVDGCIVTVRTVIEVVTLVAVLES